MTDSENEDLYLARVKIQPRAVFGFFQQLRTTTLWLMMSLFFILPWYNWHGKQAILFNLPERQFRVFWVTFWPQDFYLLSWLLIIAAVGLLFITMIAGRVWCGYTCPQTAWTRLFMWIEKTVEGNRNQRIKLDKQALNFKKVRLRITKHLLWLLISLATAFTFVAYFTPALKLQQNFWTLQASGWEVFWIAFFTLATYMNAGWMREQICLYVCPYARFQGSMFDDNSLIIAYDKKRGEPRGSRSRKQDPKAKALGSCIDCQLCVQVCPTGIDIREGLQIGCIGCAACVDACDAIMDKMQYPRHLISYTTQNAQAEKPNHFLRPRVIATGMILMIMLSAFTYTLFTRIPIDLSVIRDRGALYHETVDGLIANNYRLKVINMSQEVTSYQLSVEGLSKPQWAGRKRVILSPGEKKTVAISLTVSPRSLKNANTHITFFIKANNIPEFQASRESRFISPFLKEAI